PELPEKLRTQRRAQIRPCISCENCIDSMESASMSCAVNGLSGREGELSIERSATPKRVIVVGAGPGGLETARLAALRGRRVTLVERGERLAPEVGAKRLTEHMDALDRLGVAVNTGVAYEEITARGIAIRPERGSRHEIAADTVVIAGELEAD